MPFIEDLHAFVITTHFCGAVSKLVSDKLCMLHHYIMQLLGMLLGILCSTLIYIIKEFTSYEPPPPPPPQKKHHPLPQKAKKKKRKKKKKKKKKKNKGNIL